MLLIEVLAIVAVSVSAGGLTEQQVELQETPATACQLLSRAFRGQVSFPGNELYIQSHPRYWSSQQPDPKPSCRFFPKGARDIQKALADVCIPHNVSITITSSGQSSVVGGSDGITIDLSRLSDVHLGDQNRTVSFGPGARWGAVYSKLEPLDLAVAGSRTATDAVGGFVLGGGLSWFSNEVGWACDSVLEFEVVTPRGEILWVNDEMHEGLFWGLKGSGGALGIVTKIKMPTIKSESVYGGVLEFEEQHFPRVSRALAHLAISAHDDRESLGQVSIVWTSSRQVIYSAYLVDTANRPDSPGLTAFSMIPHRASKLRYMTIAESAEELADGKPHSLHRSQFTLTARLRPDVMQAVHDLVLTMSEGMTFDRDDSIRMTFQPITIPHLLKSYQTNIYDLDPIRGPFVLISVEMSWDDSSQDAHFAEFARLLRETIERELRSMNVLKDCIYPNYAGTKQNPFASEKWRKSPTGKMLRAVARKYDPEGIWRKMVPGVWHV